MIPYIILDRRKNEFTALCDDCENASVCRIYQTMPEVDKPYIKWCKEYKIEEKKQ